ncbi:LysR family transcriptional regulator [Tabrizicola piscis]|jgi:DNA-binding transcriptional LysR family regulator|uniref:LysR family transcriptional regulator n=1 Tax=Tabrizicola piscis TaxID=2494374 RepID=A0A3S8U487_9RHOB|nr:LysR family transcriptional regulator [Tabrizicola piscis]AZL58360.1 LysR family transcriptional regulator [Tabrizicola piscis]
MAEAEGRVTLWGIEVFVAAAEEGSISAAARRLGVSPSAISQQLSGLETALGAILLDRSGRPMPVTPAGVMFRRHAQTILNAASEARAELAMADLAGMTTLRLGVIEDFDSDVTPRLLSLLAQDLKGCRFLLETGASHRLLDQLEARALDIVVAADSETGSDADATWREVHPLMSEPFVAVTPPGARIEDLPLILYTARHLMGRQIATHLSRQGLRPAHRFELDSYAAILAMVAGGEGWTILTPLALHQARAFRSAVEVRPLPFAPLGRTLSLTARAGIFRDMPAQIAARLKPLIAQDVIAPALADCPWLAPALRVL